MAIVDLFSKQQKKLRGEAPDLFQYSNLPRELRVQIVHIWKDTLGDLSNGYRPNIVEAYEVIVSILRREYGVFKLPGSPPYADIDSIDELVNFVLNEPDSERVLDAVQISFRIIDRHTSAYGYLYRMDARELASKGIEELNARFREHGVGYHFANGNIFRVDSEFLHDQAVKPSLRVLNQKYYAGAQQEFLKAYDHYRRGNSKEALNECLKTFESVMKSICTKRGWVYATNATAKDLIQICLDNQLIPTFWRNHFSSLRSLLGSV